jgi:hypothetical protein
MHPFVVGLPIALILRRGSPPHRGGHTPASPPDRRGNG